MKNTLLKVVSHFPEMCFICLGDLNGDFDPQLNLKIEDNKFVKVNIFPTDDEDVTCKKMRTLTQTQKCKALQLNFCKKDYIVTDLKICQGEVVIADGYQVTKKSAPVLPNSDHPFDHFIVEAILQKNERIISSSPLLKKKRISKEMDEGLKLFQWYFYIYFAFRFFPSQK